MTNITMDRTDPPFLMDKSTISMAMFNSYVKLPKGTCVLGQSYMCFFKTWYIYLYLSHGPSEQKAKHHGATFRWPV